MKYLEIEGEFECFEQRYQKYQSWIRFLPYDFKEVPTILEKLDPTSKLLKNIENMINLAASLKVDVTEEMKKLNLLRQWCKLSEKILSCKKKPTINAVQNLKIIMEKVRYPENQVSKNIIRLDS